MRKVFRCSRCGKERPRRQPGRPEKREREAVRTEAPPLATREARRVAEHLLSRARGRTVCGVRGLIGKSGLPGSLVEEWLETFMRCGWIRLRERLAGSRAELAGVLVRDFASLEEFCHPGREAARARALSAAVAGLGGLHHPIVHQVRDLLHSPEADSLAPELISALAVVARHAASGDACARRVLSARELGDSKALDRLSGQLERILGPLEKLNIREGGSVFLVGGRGGIECRGQLLRLSRLPPFVGLASDTASILDKVHFPPAGLLVVENMTTFEACCRREVEGAADTMVAWAAGFPGRSVLRLVELAARAGVDIRVWADIDLSGVRIFRLVHERSGRQARPWHMSPRDLVAAPVALPLSARQARAIEADLRAHPQEPLSDTLEAILQHRCWVEQEALMSILPPAGGNQRFSLPQRCKK